MIEKLRKELWELRAQIKRRESVGKELEQAHQTEASVWREEYQLRSKVRQLNGEMEELEKRSVRNLFPNVKKRKEVQFEALDQELRMTEIELRDVQRRLEECSVHLKSLEAARQGYGDLERRFREAYEKLKGILKAETADGSEITGLESAVRELDKQLREIDQAVSAGGLALQEARNMQGSLQDAKGYGTWDMLGGGTLVTAAKHKKLGTARKQAEELRSRVAQFNSALTDVNIGLHLGQDNVGDFLRFADFFLDGLLADWAVQSRIGESQAEIARVEGSLRTMIRHLETMYRTMEHEKQNLKEKLVLLVLGDPPPEKRQ